MPVNEKRNDCCFNPFALREDKIEPTVQSLKPSLELAPFYTVPLQAVPLDLLIDP